MTNRDLIIFVTLSFMWSLSFVFYRIGVPELAHWRLPVCE